MRLSDLELDLLYSLVDFACSRSYEDSYGDIYFEDDGLYISRQILNNYPSLEDFQRACNCLLDKLARG